MGQRSRVTVLGSLNADISLQVPHLPRAGETVLSLAAAVAGSGGKGANQAVAAARLGAAVRMIGCCGDDQFGSQLRAGLDAEGIDASGVRVITGVTSGLALITVDPAGENAIAVAAGANGMAGDQEVTAAFAAPCDVLVLSAEVPVPVLGAVLERAREAGILCVLNLAPVPAGAAGLLAGGVDWLVVNEHEAAVLLGQPFPGPDGGPEAGRDREPRGGPEAGRDREPRGRPEPGSPEPGRPEPGRPEPGRPEATAGERDARVTAGALARLGARHSVVTLGASGAVVSGPEGAAAVPGYRVASIDSVGAGDAFVAALAVALAAGAGPAAAVRAACAAGATATTCRGAQEALPRPGDILSATGFAWPAAE